MRDLLTSRNILVPLGFTATTVPRAEVLEAVGLFKDCVTSILEVSTDSGTSSRPSA